MLEAAERQQIPYSVIKLPASSEIEGAQVRVPEARSILRRGAGRNAADAKSPRESEVFLELCRKITKRRVQVQTSFRRFCLNEDRR